MAHTHALLPPGSASTVCDGAWLSSMTTPPAATAALIRCSATSGHPDVAWKRWRGVSCSSVSWNQRIGTRPVASRMSSPVVPRPQASVVPVSRASHTGAIGRGVRGVEGQFNGGDRARVSVDGLFGGDLGDPLRKSMSCGHPFDDVIDVLAVPVDRVLGDQLEVNHWMPTRKPSTW